MQPKKPVLWAVLTAVLIVGVFAHAGQANGRGPDGRVERLIGDLQQKESNFTLGLQSFSGAAEPGPIIGWIKRDQALGYPKSSFGFSPRVAWRKYVGQPRNDEVARAAKTVAREAGLRLSEGEWRDRVKAQLGKRVFPYVGFALSDDYTPGVDGGLLLDWANYEGSGVNAQLGAVWKFYGDYALVPYAGVAYSF